MVVNKCNTHAVIIATIQPDDIVTTPVLWITRRNLRDAEISVFQNGNTKIRPGQRFLTVVPTVVVMINGFINNT